MTTRCQIEETLLRVEQQIDAITRRAAELERALAAMLALGADAAAADEALRSAWHALGLYRYRRDMLLRSLENLSGKA